MTPPTLQDIHDIRGPIAIPYWWIVPLLAVGAVALVALGFAAYRLLRKRIRAHARSAAELAIERIERARALIGTGQAAEFSAELSDAVRVYIEARFGLRAAHKTTEEFLHDLLASEASPIAGHREALEDFLSGCDLAKFARFTLSSDQMTAMVGAARRFVESTEAPKEPDKAPILPRALHAAAAATESAS